MKYNKEISLKDISYILIYLINSNINSLYLYGGEPTLHSKFNEIIKLIEFFKFKTTIFTNGVFDGNHINKITNKALFYYIINLNNVSEMGQIKNNIIKLKENNIKYHLTLTLTDDDIEYFTDFIKTNNIKNVRIDFARPSTKKSNNFYIFKYYGRMINKLLKIFKEYDKYGINTFLDCPLPYCMIPNEPRQYLCSRKLVYKCSSNIEILPNLNIKTCNPSYYCKNIKITDFKTIQEAKDFLNYHEDKLRWDVFMINECIDCNHRINKECQGGCIGLKKEKLNKYELSKSDLKAYLNKAKPKDQKQKL